MKNTIKVNADTLENECGWEIAPEDKGADLYITWDAVQGNYLPRVRVYRNPEGGYLEEYSIDSEMFFTETLPALKESNEILEEEYND